MIRAWNGAMTKEQLLNKIEQMHKSIQRIKKSEVHYKHSVEILKKSKNEYRELVEFANSIILRIDTAGNILFMNKFARKYFRYASKEIIRKNVIGTIVPEVESSGRDLTAFIKSICQNTGKHMRSENQNIKKDGSRVWILWTNRAVLDEKGRVVEIICIGNDITEKKDAERALQESHDQLEKEVRERTRDLIKTNDDLLFEIVERKVNEEGIKESETKYRSIVEGAIEGIFQTTIDGKCIMANAALAGLLGYASPEEYISLTSNIKNLYVDTSRRLELIKLLKPNGYVKGFETQFYKKDKSKIWVSMNLRAIYDERGNFIYYQGTVIDITAEITLRRVLDETTGALSMTVEVRDPYTAGHQARVTKLAVAISKEMNFSEDHTKAIQTAGLLHDIGKIYVPAEFLSRPGKISAHEFNILKQHASAGYEILKNIEYKYPVAEIVYEHHERMNGSGYPRGLSGDQILIESRIIAIADVVEAMASPRPYRPALGIAKALNEIQENRGIIYDKNVADICLNLFNKKGFQLEN
jgi:PAS domain S-box-containing protein/putative nucleotidyltransferase with HDIG domain